MLKNILEKIISGLLVCLFVCFNKPTSSSDKPPKKDSEEGKSSTGPPNTKKKASGKSKMVKIQETSKWYGSLIFPPSIF